MAEGCENSSLWEMAACTQHSQFPTAASSLGEILCISVCCVFLCRKTTARKKSSLCSYRKEKKKPPNFNLSAAVQSPLRLVFQEGIQWHGRISRHHAGVSSTVAGWVSQPWPWGSRNLGTAMENRNLPLREEKKSCDLKLLKIMKHRIPGSLFLLSLETCQKTRLGKDKGASSTGTKYWELH